MLFPIIMAGGSGSRLWPLSRERFPKQFLTLSNDNYSMLQATVKRLDGLDISPPVLICNEEHRFLAAEQMRVMGYDTSNIILEPVGRNTAPAIALAALRLCEKGDDPVLLVLAADHVIRNSDAFQLAVRDAYDIALKGKLVTFGIVPDRPETGYGYIQKGEALCGGGVTVKRFVEKPDLETANKYVQSGEFLWNSGMFMFRAKRYLEELQKHAPNVLSCCMRALNGGADDLHFTRVDEHEFNSCPSISIDYAVMEKTDHAAMVALNAGWNDVGSWSALWDIAEKDSEGNACKGDVLANNTSGSYIHATSRLVATVGVRDLIVIDTKDALLVAHKSEVQSVKTIVEKLRASNRNESVSHREVYRPWGIYDCIDAGERYQVKRIMVNPGAKLSVQMHHHRAEHWIVVSGTAKVTNGEKTYLVTENQSTYIPVGQIHALENPGVIPLELIEVQSGSYLGEDDIVRFEDRYGRS
ncbi:mannose-1-phosphate guanylyltransferase/mannose-6-phosphate isomerase [Pseudomonas sp. NPDC089743]|uniref:mannose-1-phosphate guanylyltransferase/mannose-6-phosphate isomerase n=1 Tax=Pseudomonas sp. NPDC089743 TaxID=3364471 RepID=UPI00382CF1DF